MKKQLFLFVLTAVSGISAGFTVSCIPVGGPCTYKDHEGIVTIKEIRPIQDENTNAENTEKKLYVVSYLFEFDERKNLPKEVNSTSKGLELKHDDIEKRGVKTGAKFHAKAKYIEKGTCNPGPDLESFEKWVPVN